MDAPRLVVPKVNRFLTRTGTFTLIQGILQFIMAVIGLLQYFCIVNFLRDIPLLMYIKLLYYHNPSRCGGEIIIGEVIDGLPNQAFIYLPTMPETTSRTFVVTTVYLTLSVLWIVASILLIKGGHRQHFSNHIHWPWVSTTFMGILVDIIAAALYGNDVFYTGTFQDILSHVGGTASGVGNYDTDTMWASLIMTILVSRFGVILLINMILAVYTVQDCTRFRTSVTTSESNSNTQGHTNSGFDSGQDNSNSNGREISNDSSKQEEDSAENGSSTPSAVVPKIPRPGLSASFRSMKAFLLENTKNSLTRARSRVNFQPGASPESPHADTFENLIAEQQRRLRSVAVDTSGRNEPATSRSLPHLPNIPELQGAQRSTGGRLPSQMPWAYIAGAPANRMRDQLPPDEDLPPVPLPDYTAIQSARKASVHRAASSLSSLTHAKDYSNPKISHPVSGSLVDVLY